MVKKAILLLSLTAAIGSTAQAQSQVGPCLTDEKFQEYIKLNPDIIKYQEQLNIDFRQSMALRHAIESAQRVIYPYTTDTVNYPMVYIPVVVHVVHDFGNEYVDDNEIYEMLNRINVVYRKQNQDLSSVIAPFQPYIGNPRIEFRLATKDPSGNPTKGIVRKQSYLTAGGDDQAKFNVWAPDRYLNIWLIKNIGRDGVAAYSNFPSSAAAQPHTDGIIGGAQYMSGSSKTYEHEIGHYLNLQHPWNSSGQAVSLGCGDDEVDDTPPTRGHFSSGAPNFPSTGGNCNSPVVLYDSLCAHGYFKTYNNGNDVDTADYPDTTNVQNIMDYANCPIMFTQQQVHRMRQALNSTIGNRNKLISPQNLEVTGIMLERPDLKPVPAFSVERGQGTSVQSSERTFFLCMNSTPSFTFMDRSWGDTIVNNGVAWSFSNGGTATPATTSWKGVVNVKFSEPGWATVTQKVTGNNSGDSTLSKIAVYVADNSNPIDANASPYYQEFENENDLAQWPIFNYYDNEPRWRVTNSTGYYDKYCMKYEGHDDRTYPSSLVGTPMGDYDDFFTPAFDLSKFGSSCNLSFLTAGVFRTSNLEMMVDTLEVFISTDCGSRWEKLKTYTRLEIGNNGTYDLPYMPQWTGEWSLKNIDLNNPNYKKNVVYFRFRYKPGGNHNLTTQKGTGNNFYIDRINVNGFPTGVNTLIGDNRTIAVAPNPTSGNSYVVVSTKGDETVKVAVTDVTGKLVYRTEQKVQGTGSIEIPASVLTVKGMYLVQVATGSETRTEKLVVQ